MLANPNRLMIFTDLDGCLLNKHDYDWQPAKSSLLELRKRQIPVVLNSSKTVPEMIALSGELGLQGNTLISENGSVICWGNDVTSTPSSPSTLQSTSQTDHPTDETEVIGASRTDILSLLDGMKRSFRFRSFADMGVSGVALETQLSAEKAALALKRRGTEPLLWDDSDEHRVEFERQLVAHNLTLTKGGRFWHVAGRTSKGIAMQRVIAKFSKENERLITAAIGDSPIDQSMLDAADVPIGIPTANGLGVNIDGQRGIVATEQGAAGWAQAITELLSRIDGSVDPDLNSWSV
ncbi:HAD-IIB family hydrolase [Stieleria varia]|uniref:Putative mannosyl-3-phosphoglycerate phosphatase n=1 Tax=Stieleria varia TaxID=2528005 RepID=A0A5C5ZZF7_9BACT|nr:HAD-IIB family hydrolase [Stieleria varia]TWT92421.1 putative mannosyl-3-phosphoglycerate phosphatase [Stieleria varia]